MKNIRSILGEIYTENYYLLKENFKLERLSKIIF